MSITVDWDDSEHTTLHYTYIGKWTWDENNQAVARGRELARDQPQGVDVIVDFSQSGPFPKGAFSGFRNSLSTTSTVFSIVVIISRGTFVHAMLTDFVNLYGKFGKKFFVAKSAPQAREIIAQNRSARPPLAG